MMRGRPLCAFAVAHGWYRSLEHLIEVMGSPKLCTGNPEPNITWTKDGSAPDRNLGSIRSGRWSLILEDLVVSDSGNYTCIVCNLCGCINFTFKVDIIGKLISFVLPSHYWSIMSQNCLTGCGTAIGLVPGNFSLQLHHLEHEPDNSPPSTANIKNEGRFTSTLYMWYSA